MVATNASLSGLNAAAMSLAVTANNVANSNTAGYKAKRLDLEDTKEGGVRPAAIRESEEPAPEGTSNVDLASEFVNLMVQSDTYKANLKALEAQNQILGTTLDMKA
jgi:flagellar basal-body rod protein FlgC